MKRKENNPPPVETAAVLPDAPEDRAGAEPGTDKDLKDYHVLLVEDGQVRPFSPDDYTASTLYQVVDSFAVECRLARPEEPGSLLFEGKKPSKKTIPILVLKNGNSLLLESWESLEAKPDQLADAVEVIGASPVKQVFVLKRK